MEFSHLLNTFECGQWYRRLAVLNFIHTVEDSIPYSQFNVHFQQKQESLKVEFIAFGVAVLLELVFFG